MFLEPLHCMDLTHKIYLAYYELARSIKPDARFVGSIKIYQHHNKYSLILRDRSTELEYAMRGLAAQEQPETFMTNKYVSRQFMGRELHAISPNFEIVGAQFIATYRIGVI